MIARLTAALVLASIVCLSGCALRPPPGYTALFNGRDLSGWRGLVEPPDRARLSAEELAGAQAAADARMREHWSVRGGELVFDGRGESLCTAREFGDFELLVDWKIEPGGDSGIYLRGTPQVQIWDNPVGSGGLYNNQRHPSKPLALTDRPPGKWNTFRIRMEGDRVTVHLNGVAVVDRTPLESFWDRSRPLPARGPIELQAHGSRLWFRNVFVRELDDR